MDIEHIGHYVITRFLSNSKLGFGERIFDEDVIQDRLSYLRTYFIPTMNNQTVKNFTVIFLINDKHDTKNSGIKELYDMKLDMPFKVLKESEYMKYIRYKTADAHKRKLILTRMDDDDLVNYKAVEEIQKYAIEINNDIFSYGYNSGMILYEGKLYPFPTPSYRAQGYFSIFESVCVWCESLWPDLNIYSYPHTTLKTDIRNYAKRHGLNVDHAFERYSLENFVWIRHKNTSTELLTNSPIRNRKLEKEIQIDPDRFKLLFGVELDKIILNK